MLSKFFNLWRPTGTLSRGTYALLGLAAFAIKYNLDRLIASFAFHRHWDIFNYWIPIRDVVRISSLPRIEWLFLETMVVTALPFIWFGVSLTMKRLRSAVLPLPLVILFFVPFVNLFFFLMLCILPERDALPSGSNTPRQSFLARIVPRSSLGSAAASLLITVPVGLGLAWLGTTVITHYGWGLFVAIPFCMGFAASLIDGINGPRTMSACIRVACLAVAVLGAALLEWFA
jgi:hypothetical protein